LSNDVKDPFYNVYLSRPFALTYERMSIAELATLTSSPDRAIVWSDFYLEAFIDPEMQSNPVLGPFAARVSSASSGSDLILLPRACVVAESFPATYIPGPNPPPLSDTDKLPGTFGTISAHNGEFRHETIDVALPGKRMPIVFERVQGGQDLYEGAFGRGWDFTYNQRLTPLRPEIIGRDHRLPLILRALSTDSTVAGPGDLLWHTGRGRLVLYTNKGSQPPTEVATDPLLTVLGWQGKIRTYYLPASAEAGVFDPIFEFHDGQYVRLTPDGRQYWYNRAGRLEKIYHRYVNNFHKLVYNHRGELIKIIDAAINNDRRFLEIGYYRLSGDSEFVPNLDVTTTKVFQAGKIARLRDYAQRVIDFFYTDDGLLEKRLGFEGSSANNGDGGRVETVYLYTDPCSGFLQGVTTGGSSASSALFAASLDSITGVSTGSGNGAGGAVSITPPSQNVAAMVGGSSTGATGPDGAQTTFTFDGKGFPAKVEYSGPNAGTATVEMVHGAYGLLEKVVYPLGSAVELKYDTNNTLLRMRGNLLEEKRLPGSRPGSTLTRSFASYDNRYNLPTGTVTDFNGKTATFTLTSDGKDIEKIDYQDAGSLSYAYNSFGQVELVTTPEGLVIDPSYNADGFKISEDRGGVHYGYHYGSGIPGMLGVPDSIDLPEGDDVTSIQYDDRLLLLGFTRGAYSEKRGYDRNGNPKYIERDLGGGRKRIERRTYNQVNFLEKLEVENVEVNGSGSTLKTEFISSANDAWRIKEIHYPGGQRKMFTYDHLGHIVTMQMGSYNETYVRDLHGNLLSLRQGGQETRKYDYDGHDRLIKLTQRLGQAGDDVTDFEYFGEGQLKRMTVNSAGFGVVREITVSDIDGLGRPKDRTIKGDSGDATFNFTYNASSGGEIVSAGPRDTTTFKYDAAGRTTGWSDFLANVIATPDGNGNLLTIMSSESGGTYTSGFTYDGLDHLKTHFDGVGDLVTITPLADGSPGTVKDGRGNITQNTFTLYGEIASSTRPSGVQFVYHYDENRQPTLTGDGTSKGNRLVYDTDTFHLASRELRSGAAFTFGSFNALDLPETVTTPVGDTTLAYDLQGRVTSEAATHQQGENYEVTIKLDALGRVRESSYGKAKEHTAILTYDKLGPLRSAEYAEALGTFTVQTDVNTDGTRKSLTYPSGNVTLTETRDNGGRLTGISGAGDLYTVQTFKGAQQPGVIHLGGGVIIESNEYDARRRLRARSYTSGGRVLADVRYRYDLADNREARQEVHRHGRADLFTYDGDNRLTRSDFGARPAIAGANRTGAEALGAKFDLGFGLFSRTYSYENTRDLLTGSTLINPDAALLPAPPPFAASLGAHDSMNFALEVDGVNRAAPDGLGNPTEMTLWVRRPGAIDPVPVQATLTFNAFSHLVKVAYSDQGVSVIVEYQQRPDGSLHYRKVTRDGTVVSERALIHHDGQLLEEFEASGGTTLVARYFYADEDSPFAAELADAGGNLRRYYYLRDAQGSVMAVADENGEVRERVSYDAWGQPVLQGRDTAPPQLSLVLQDTNNELLLQFTETVMPPLTAAGAGPDLVTTTADLASAFALDGPGGPVPIDAAVYEENLAGFPFGTVIRLVPQGVVPASLTLRVRAGGLVDEWGLPNPAEVLGLTLVTPGSVLFRGPLAGSTAPSRVERSTVGSPFLFHGQYFDYDTGLIYLRARFYDPFTGSFLGQDPMGYEDSVNLYAGFAHNPTSRRDPTGFGMKFGKRRGGGASSGGPSRRGPGFGKLPRDLDATIPDGAPTIPDGAPLDTVPNTTVRRSTLANTRVDTVTSPGPGSSRHQPAAAQPPPPVHTEFVFRGLAFTREQAAEFEISQLMRGQILSQSARKNIPDETMRRALLAEINERIARGQGLEGFSATQLHRMSDDMKLAVAHLGYTEFGISTGKRARSRIRPDGSRDPVEPGAVEWAINRAKGMTRAEKVQHDPYLLVLEVNRNAGVRGHNPAEADEVTFLGRLEPISAKFYRVNQDNNGNITFTLMNEFRR
jgi:RHS repeat-associated protein